MNKIIILTMLALLSFAAGYFMQGNRQDKTKISEITATPVQQANKNNCLMDECLYTEADYPVGKLPDGTQDLLNQALMDEYKAYARYQKVVDTFGAVRPFIMIVRAEEQHVASLKGLYDKYGIEIPENELLGTIVAPDSIQEACSIGVSGELENIKLYKETLLPSVQDFEDIKIVFTNLMNASEQKHLPAFERCD